MRAALALAAAALLLPAATAAAKYKKCPDGNFVLDRPPIFSRDDGSRFDAVILTGKKVAIRSGCKAVRAHVTRTKKGTKISARWRDCQGVANVRLKAKIDPDCLKLAGKLKSKSLGEIPFLGAAEDPPSPDLPEGLAVTKACPAEEPNAVLGGIEALCKIFGVDPCVSQDAFCTKYQRQIFTGTRLGDPTAGLWNGRGGSGDPMEDALLCTMRQLSPELDGPLHSEAQVDLGPVGLVFVHQEVGYNDWDRLAHRFSGYRRVEVKMPIIGDAQPITQQFSLQGRVLGTSGNSAGTYPILYGYGIDVSTEKKGRGIEFSPPDISIQTPYGAIAVKPEYIYKSFGATIDSPYAANPEPSMHDVSGLFSPSGPDLRLVDLYGIYPGASITTVPVVFNDLQAARGAWSSQLGLGTRGVLFGQEPWSPPATGPIDRPDLDLLMPRSLEEALPSVYANASATVTWPDNWTELLPAWVGDLPFLTDESPKVVLVVKPTIETGVSSQLFLGVEERTDHEVGGGEFEFHSCRRSTMNLKAQAGAYGTFKVDLSVIIRVKLDIPFVGEKSIVDVDHTIPIPLFGDPPTDDGHLDQAVAISLTDGTPDFPETVDALSTFDEELIEGGAVSSFYDACFAPEQPTAQDTPVTTPKKGDPADLFDFALYPCNICIYTRAGTFDSIKQQYLIEAAKHPNDPDWPAWSDAIPGDWHDLFFPATTAPSWSCDDPGKMGCYDLCRFEPPSTLVVEKEPADIIPTLPATPDFDEERALLDNCQ